MRGPVPHVVETFELHEAPGGTRFLYAGELGTICGGWAHGGATEWRDRGARRAHSLASIRAAGRARRLLVTYRRQSIDQLGTLGEVYQRDRHLYRAFMLYHRLRLPFALEDPAVAPRHLDAWLAWAARSRLEPFVKAACTLRRHRAGVLAAIRLGLTNGRLERLNSNIRSFGFHSAAALIALVYLCCSGVVINLPR